MNTLLIAVHAKYFHTSLGLRNIKEYCGKYKEHMKILEFTINQQLDYIISIIYKEKPDLICFSAYIWNIEMVVDIIKCLKVILPNVVVVLGGPEATFNTEVSLQNCDVLVKGEGEASFLKIMEYFIENKGELKSIYQQEEQEQLPLDLIPFAYANEDMNALKNKIIYYETSRGCPFNCKYCLSGETTARYLGIDRCLDEISFFIKHRVKQVKFVDRTFNANKKHALQIFKHIIENQNGFTNFHFEIAADLLDDEMFSVLEKAPKGLIQFEIGVQSLNLQTLNEVSRKTDLDKLFTNVNKLQNQTNIHSHLDLIAGLPLEDFNKFKISFNSVYSLEPDQLQLGFLKVLHGSVLRAEKERYGILYKPMPPYTVLSTNELSYNDIVILKSIEELVEMYYNANKCKNTIKYLINFFESPFDFYLGLSEYFEENGYNDVSVGKITLFQIIHDFSRRFVKGFSEEIKELLIFDLLCNDRVINLPEFLKHDINKQDSLKIRRLSVENTKRQYIYKFNYDVLAHKNCGELKERENFVLFKYGEENKQEEVLL